MKTYILILLLAIFAPLALADEKPNCDIPGNFSAETLAAMKKACEQTITTPPPVKDATQWGQMAQEFAKALGIAAHEIGVSVNEFVASPAGYITVGVVLWKTIGGSIAKYGLVLCIWLLGTGLIRSMWTSTFIDREYKNIFGTLRTKRTRVYYKWDDASDTQVFCIALVLLGMAAFSAITLANM